MLDLRYHGNGFIQVVLNPVTRMHIYDPEFRPHMVENARIHDHSFTFTSQVLMGFLCHAKFSVASGPGVKNAEHGLYYVDKSQEGEPLRRLISCSCGPGHMSTYSAGESYTFGGPHNFHDTWAEELTITVMTKVGWQHAGVQKHMPRIVSLRDETPDDAFSYQPEQRDLRMIVHRALSMLS